MELADRWLCWSGDGEAELRMLGEYDERIFVRRVTSIFRVLNTAHTTLPKCSRRNNVPLPRHLRFGLWQRSECPVTAFD